MKNIYASYESPLGQVTAHYDGEKIFAAIGDYCHATWVPQSTMTGLEVSNRAAYGYGKNHPHAFITINWWSNQVPSILSALFAPTR